jgi:Raf kinase inhibitor-like YbhB/YbcL family protein
MKPVHAFLRARRLWTSSRKTLSQPEMALHCKTIKSCFFSNILGNPLTPCPSPPRGRGESGHQVWLRPRAALRYGAADCDAGRLEPYAREGLITLNTIAVIALVFCSVCGILKAGQKSAQGQFRLESAAFRAGGFIPRKYTCNGDNLSPALTWTAAPVGTKSLALIVADPDAPSGTWIHWIVYNVPPSAHGLPEGVPKTGEIEGGTRQGTSSFQNVGYGGPCPPPGDPHHYHFMLYALNAPLRLNAGATREQVDDAMKGHILAKTELVGLYQH